VSAPRYKNPTGLAVGKEGTLFGRSARVVGRSVLKSADGYQWDEYHLKLDDGSEVTLVFESGIWKRFALFEPKTTINAQSAADLGVGDEVYLGDESAEVDYVGQSRVLFIEGKAPEGYRVGSEAHYFNAEAGNRLFVVSWTGLRPPGSLALRAHLLRRKRQLGQLVRKRRTTRVDDSRGRRPFPLYLRAGLRLAS
jgi:hypothetical protein